MTLTPELALVDSRQTLRRRMLAQRQLIAYQLEPVPRAEGGYPRSRVIRFLTERPVLAVGLLTALATLFAGTRFVKPLIAVLALTKILRPTG
jgi:hypothetical protein